MARLTKAEWQAKYKIDDDEMQWLEQNIKNLDLTIIDVRIEGNKKVIVTVVK